MCQFSAMELLQMRVSEQEKQIEELSVVVTEHWKSMELMRAQIRELKEKLTVLEQGARLEAVTEPPPHW